jgi:hypothetical protein
MTIITRSQYKTNHESEEKQRVQIKKKLNIERNKLMKKIKKQNMLLSKIGLEICENYQIIKKIKKENRELINIENVVRENNQLTNIELEVNIDFDVASTAWRENKRSIGNGQYKYIKK